MSVRNSFWYIKLFVASEFWITKTAYLFQQGTIQLNFASDPHAQANSIFTITTVACVCLFCIENATHVMNGSLYMTRAMLNDLIWSHLTNYTCFEACTHSKPQPNVERCMLKRLSIFVNRHKHTHEIVVVVFLSSLNWIIELKCLRISTAQQKWANKYNKWFSRQNKNNPSPYKLLLIAPVKIEHLINKNGSK